MAALKDCDYLFKVFLVGPFQCGKSSLARRFLDNTFTEPYGTPLGISFKIKAVDLEGKRIKFMVFDGPGQERFHSLTAAYYKSVHGLLLIFNLTSTDSFQQIDGYFEDVRDRAGKGTPMVLVGTMSDMAKERKVTYNEAMQKAKAYGVTYIEVSSKTDDNVSKAFLTLAKDIMHRAVAKPGTTTPAAPAPAPAAKKPADPEERKESPASVKAERDALLKRIEAIEKVVRLLGADGSLLADNINKICAAPKGNGVVVDAEGNVKLTE